MGDLDLDTAKQISIGENDVTWLSINNCEWWKHELQFNGETISMTHDYNNNINLTKDSTISLRNNISDMYEIKGNISGTNTLTSSVPNIIFSGANTTSGDIILQDSNLFVTSTSNLGTSNLQMYNSSIQFNPTTNTIMNRDVTAHTPSSFKNLSTYTVMLNRNINITKELTLDGGTGGIAIDLVYVPYYITGDANSKLIIKGSNTISTNRNAFVGRIIITQGATLSPTQTGSSINYTSTLEVNGHLALVTGIGVGCASIEGTGIIDEVSGDGTGIFTIKNGKNATWNGLIRDSYYSGLRFLRIIKEGTGTQIFATKATYSGGTLITKGTLSITHPEALGTGEVTISAGGALRLNGNTILNTIINNGGAVIP